LDPVASAVRRKASETLELERLLYKPRQWLRVIEFVVRLFDAPLTVPTVASQPAAWPYMEDSCA